MVSLLGDVERRRIDDAAVDGDAALRDPFPRHRGARPARRAPPPWRCARRISWRCGRLRARACRIRACARDRRHGRQTPDVLQRSCCRPRSRGAADRHPLRCADVPASRCGLRALGGDDRISADLHANAKSADAPRRRGRRAARQSAACRNCAHRRGRDGTSRSPRSSRFCHGFGIAARSDGRQNPCADLGRARRARTSSRRQIFSQADRHGDDRHRAAAGALRAIALRTVAVLAKTFAARRVGPLLAITFARRVRLFVAKLPVGEAPGRARIVAITARRTVVAIEIRAVAARRERALFAATIFARLERALCTVVTARREYAYAAMAITLADDRSRLVAIGRRGASPRSRTADRRADAARRQNPGAADDHRRRACRRRAFHRPNKASCRTIWRRRTCRHRDAARRRLHRSCRQTRAWRTSSPAPSPPRSGPCRRRLAATGPVTPAAGIVVFVAVAGHEWSLGTNELAIRSGWAVIAITRAHFAQGAFSRKTGIHVC